MPLSGSPPRRVALLIETSNRYGRDLLNGIRDWVGAHGRWAIRLASPPQHPAAAEWLRHWKGDGIIARVASRSVADALRRTGLPIVDVSAEHEAFGLPRVNIDNRAVAEMAASHLIGKRIPHFAFCGDRRFLWSRERGEEFRRILRGRGAACADFPGVTRQAGRSDVRRGHAPGDPLFLEVCALADWLKRLRKPLGVFACHDSMAQKIIEACHQAGLSIPDEVSVLGVDDDELICELCDPPLSSILPNARRSGYEAAAVLSELMSGRPGGVRLPPAIPPIRVVERRSTESDAVDDKHVAAALLYIRTHACDGIDVSEVLRHVGVSRTLLERKFVQMVGVTPHRLIKQRRLERVRELLSESSLPIAAIADIAGFESASYLSAVFHAEVGQTPRAYRLGLRASGANLEFRI